MVEPSRSRLHPAFAPFEQSTQLRSSVDGLAGLGDTFASALDLQTSLSGLRWLHRDMLPSVNFKPLVRYASSRVCGLLCLMIYGLAGWINNVRWDLEERVRV